MGRAWRRRSWTGPSRRAGARGPSGLAARAPVGDPLLRVASLVSGLDRGAAAAARPARAAVHPCLLAAPGHARGDHAEPLLVRLEEPLGQADKRGDVGDLAYRPPGVDPPREQQL